jgi:periplasmic divalent cation tolerance protein
MTDCCMVLATCPDRDEARLLAKGLIDGQLAACVQLSEVESFYRWKEKTCIDPEVRLVIKTLNRLTGRVEQFIKAHHSYDLPQIVQVPIIGGSDEFLGWIKTSTDT